MASSCGHSRFRRTGGEKQRSSEMDNVSELVSRYIAAWNERDPHRRREIIARTWSEDGSYLDPHREGLGHEKLDTMIAGVQERFAPAYQFRLKSAVDAYGDRVRFQWEAGGTADAPMHFV